MRSIKVSASQTGTVTANSLNVRTKPSTSSSKLNLNGSDVYLVQGETVTVLEEEGDWYHISLTFNGKKLKGYVHSDFIKTKAVAKPTATPTPKPTKAPKPTATPTPTPDSKKGNGSDLKAIVGIKGEVKARSLNIRSGPGTSYGRIASLSMGDKVTVINEALENNTRWYAIKFKSGNETLIGYVTSVYIALDYDQLIKAEVGISKLKINSQANSKSAFIKNEAGNIITLKEGKNVSILDEKIVGSDKWYELIFKHSEEELSGYALASDIVFRSTVVEPTKAPTATPTPKPTPKPTKAPTPTPEPSKNPLPTPLPTVSPLPTPTPSPIPTIIPTIIPTPTRDEDIITISNIEIHRNIMEAESAYVVNTIYLNVIDNIMLSKALLMDDNDAVVLTNGQKLSVVDDVSVDNVVYYKISFVYNGRPYIGYVQAEYIYIGDVKPTSDGSDLIPGGNVTTPAPKPTTSPIYDDFDNVDFEVQMAMENFPESYKNSLRQLHASHPNWIFKAYHTGLDWNVVIQEESIPGKNTIPNNKSVEWKSLENGAYDWKKDKFVVYDGSTWVTASKEAIEYYMDPRNFFAEDTIFQFELLRFQEEYQNIKGIENVLKGTAMSNSSYYFTDEGGNDNSYTYGETFLAAAKYSGVSPYHLASRVKQEVVTGPSTLSNSVSGTYEGFEGLYNFYNIGANDSAGGGAIKNGLNYAKKGSSNAANNDLYMIPWTNPYKSIVGGSWFLGDGYINRGQDTIYLQKFNVTTRSTYFHQYMTNVEAPWAEGRKVHSAYQNMIDVPIVFSIPVYYNMPSVNAPKPTTKFNPNNRLKSLKVLDMNGEEITITPTFKQTEYNYYLIVPTEMEYVEVKATTVSKKATIAAGGYMPLLQGNNEIRIPVIAENGDVAEYIINIVKE